MKASAILIFRLGLLDIKTAIDFHCSVQVNKGIMNSWISIYLSVRLTIHVSFYTQIL